MLSRPTMAETVGPCAGPRKHGTPGHAPLCDILIMETRAEAKENPPAGGRRRPLCGCGRPRDGAPPEGHWLDGGFGNKLDGGRGRGGPGTAEDASECPNRCCHASPAATPAPSAPALTGIA